MNRFSIRTHDTSHDILVRLDVRTSRTNRNRDILRPIFRQIDKLIQSRLARPAVRGWRDHSRINLASHERCQYVGDFHQRKDLVVVGFKTGLVQCVQGCSMRRGADAGNPDLPSSEIADSLDLRSGHKRKDKAIGCTCDKGETSPFEICLSRVETVHVGQG